MFICEAVMSSSKHIRLRPVAAVRTGHCCSQTRVSCVINEDTCHVTLATAFAEAETAISTP